MGGGGGGEGGEEGMGEKREIEHVVMLVLGLTLGQIEGIKSIRFHHFENMSF